MQPQRSSQRSAVGILALVLPFVGLGWIGIHKFVMGYSKEGITWILVSLLTCGIGAVVLTVVSIVEGIVYLTMSDEEFERRYVIGHKSWL